MVQAIHVDDLGVLVPLTCCLRVSEVLFRTRKPGQRFEALNKDDIMDRLSAYVQQEVRHCVLLSAQVHLCPSHVILFVVPPLSGCPGTPRCDPMPAHVLVCTHCVLDCYISAPFMIVADACTAAWNAFEPSLWVKNRKCGHLYVLLFLVREPPP